MAESSDSLDPYDAWLEIPPEDQPPTLYRLLGIEEFESDESVIDAASKKRTAHLHQLASGPNRELVQRLMNEVARARRTLLSAENKQAYDDSLRHGPAEDSQEPATDVAASTGIQIAVDPSPARSSRGTAGRNVARSKSAANRLRIHAISVGVLLVVVLGFAAYRFNQPAKVAAKPSRVLDRSPHRSPPSGNSALAKMLAQSEATKVQPTANDRPPTGAPKKEDVSTKEQRRKERLAKRESAKRDTTAAAAMPPGKPVNENLAGGLKSFGDDSNRTQRSALADGFGEGAKTNRPATPSPPSQSPSTTGKRKWVKLELNKNWLAGLPVKEDFSTPLGNRFKVAQPGLAKVEAGRLMMQFGGSETPWGGMTLNGHSLELGQAVAIDTNLPPDLNNARFGMIAGPIRLDMVSVKRKLRLSVHKTELRSFRPKKGARTTIVLIRDQQHANRFHWIVKCGRTSDGGQAEYQGDVPAKVTVGIFCRSTSQETDVPVWADNLRIGKLESPPDFKSTRRIPIEPRSPAQP